MTITNQNIGMDDGDPFIAGDTKSIRIAVTDGDGLPFSLADATISWAVSSRPDSSMTAIISNSLGSGITVLDEPGGLFEVDLLPADTEGLAGQYFHEAEVVKSGLVMTVTRGAFLVTSAIA